MRPWKYVQANAYGAKFQKYTYFLGIPLIVDKRNDEDWNNLNFFTQRGEFNSNEHKKSER